jgi:hypothetical protein
MGLACVEIEATILLILLYPARLIHADQESHDRQYSECGKCIHYVVGKIQTRVDASRSTKSKSRVEDSFPSGVSVTSVRILTAIFGLRRYAKPRIRALHEYRPAQDTDRRQALRH